MQRNSFNVTPYPLAGTVHVAAHGMPVSTSMVMAPILAQQFNKLQAPPFPQVAGALPHTLQQKPVATPLRWEAWRWALQTHPPPKFVHNILCGIQNGFRIGLDSSLPHTEVTHNTPSAREHQQVIDAYLQTQVEKGYMAGPFPMKECVSIQSSSMAVISNKTPGKWRVVVDRSRPEGCSVNDHLRRDATHVAYSSVDDAAHLDALLGPRWCTHGESGHLRGISNNPHPPGRPSVPGRHLV